MHLPSSEWLAGVAQLWFDLLEGTGKLGQALLSFTPLASRYHTSLLAEPAVPHNLSLWDSKTSETCCSQSVPPLQTASCLPRVMEGSPWAGCGFLLGPLGHAGNYQKQKWRETSQNLSSVLRTQGGSSTDPTIRNPNLTVLWVWCLGADLPFVLLLSSFSQKVWDILPSVTAHQLHKLPPTERRGQCGKSPRRADFHLLPAGRGGKVCPGMFPQKRHATSSGCLALGMLLWLLHWAQTKQKLWRTDSAPFLAPEAVKTPRKLKDAGCVLSWEASWRSGNATENQGRNTLQITKVATKRWVSRFQTVLACLF